MRKLLYTLISCSCLLQAVPAFSNPWADVGDVRLRHSLQVLSDSGHIQLPLSEWPLMWGDIAYHIKPVSGASLNNLERKALQYVKFELNYQTSSKVRSQTRASFSTDKLYASSFGSVYREEIETGISTEWMGDSFAYHLDVTRANNAEDKHIFRADHSYLAYVLGDWALAVGSMDRWWGAGWNNSLILSNNARPIPAFSIQRKVSKPFDMKGLRLIGPWRISSFLGKLEQNRTVSSANVSGLRFSFAPSTSIEIGLSRVVQWGGSARDSSLTGLISSFTGRQDKKSVGVQLNGIDFRFGFKVNDLTSAFYGQWVNASSKQIMLAGAELAGALGFWTIDNSRLWIEASTTSAGNVDDTNAGGAVYGNEIYQSGYHYFGRSMGSGYDAGSRSLSSGIQLYFDKGSDLQLSARYVQFDASDQSLTGLQLKGSTIIKNTRLQAGIALNNKKLQTGLAELDRVGVFIKSEYRF